MTVKKLHNLILIHSVFPLFFGGGIYIVFRSKSLLMFQWFRYLNLDNIIEYLRSFFLSFKVVLPPWIYYSLPDGLWVYSFTSSLIIYWRSSMKIGRYWLIFPFGLGVVVELLQGLGVFQGTFDLIDLLFSFTGFLASILLVTYKIIKYEK